MLPFFVFLRGTRPYYYVAFKRERPFYSYGWLVNTEMKKIIWLLLIILPFEIASTQEIDGYNRRADFLKEVNRYKEAVAEKKTREIAPKTEEYKKIYYDQIKRDQEEANAHITQEDLAQSESLRLREVARKRREDIDRSMVPDKALRQAETDYYNVLRKKYSSLYGGGFEQFRNEDYDFLEAAQPVIESSENQELFKDDLYAAFLYRNHLWLDLPLEEVFLNLDKYKEEDEKLWNQTQTSLKPNFSSEHLIIIFSVLFIIIVALIIKFKGKKTVKENKSVITKTTNQELKSKHNNVTNNSTNHNENINADELLKYNNLLKEGAITQEDYDKIKNKFLERIV